MPRVIPVIVPSARRGLLMPGHPQSGRIEVTAAGEVETHVHGDDDQVLQRCLIVDDNERFLAVAQASLERQGLAVAGTAKTITEAHGGNIVIGLLSHATHCNQSRGDSDADTDHRDEPGPQR